VDAGAGWTVAEYVRCVERFGRRRSRSGRGVCGGAGMGCAVARPSGEAEEIIAGLRSAG